MLIFSQLRSNTLARKLECVDPSMKLSLSLILLMCLFFWDSTSAKKMRWIPGTSLSKKQLLLQKNIIFGTMQYGLRCSSVFLLPNALRATMTCTFSTSQLPKAVRTWGVVPLLTSTCASRHNGAQFFISHLASWLRTPRFREPTLRPSWATKQWKNTVFRDFPSF